MTDAPELLAAVCPGRPKQIDHGFSYSTGMALLQLAVRRDGYFPSALYLHDKLFPCSIFSPHSLFGCFFFLFFLYILQLCECVCVCACVCVCVFGCVCLCVCLLRKTNGDLFKHHFIVAIQINVCKDL